MSFQLPLFLSVLWLHNFDERLSIERLKKRDQGVDNVLGRVVNTRWMGCRERRCMSKLITSISPPLIMGHGVVIF